jgi:hypothetical protein
VHPRHGITEGFALEQASKVVNFLNLTLLGHPPQPPALFQIDPNLSKRSVLLSRIIRFLQSELAAESDAAYQSHIQSSSDLIDIFTHPDILNSRTIRLSLLEKPFYADMLSPTHLHRYFDHKIASLTTQLTRPPAPNFKRKFESLIKECRPSYHEELHYFPLNPAQDVFHELLLDPQMPLHADLALLLADLETQPLDAFASKFLVLFRLFRETFRIRGAIDISIAGLLLARSVYDLAFAISPRSLFPGTFSRLPQLARTLTCDDLMPPSQFFPGFEGSSLISELFGAVDAFKKAADCIARTSLFTNPLDMLFNIHCAIEIISTEVARDRRAEVFEFETIFSLFFGSLVAAHIGDFEDVAAFLIAFEAQGLLCPAFQYASVTVAAAFSQFEAFLAAKT